MTIDLSTVPLAAISIASKEMISTLLNPLKVLPSENGLPRDWRGLAHLLNINREHCTLLVQHSNPTMHILTMSEQNQKNVTIRDLQTLLEQIDRWDIIDDTEALFENDAVKYVEQQQRAQISADVIEHNVDQEVLTLGDIHRLRQGLKTQSYDAFLLYADEDATFANEVIQKLETEYNLKLCYKDRDLIAGITFEHEAVMKLISDRCNRLLIIISPNFLKSSLNTFFLNYAQALSIDNRQRKIIPCIYQNCQLPPQLRYMFTLNYNRKGLYDFWGKLRDSIQAPTIQIPAKVANNEITSTIQKATEIMDTLSFKDNNTLQTCRKNNKEPLTHSQEKTESYVVTKRVDDVKNVNAGSNKNKKLLQWLKKDTGSWKVMKQSKHKQQLITVNNLPSLNNLDSLNLSSNSIREKKKENIFDKFTKTMHCKKTAVKL